MAIMNQTQDARVKDQLETRIKEVMIERDIRALGKAVSRYREREGHGPPALRDLVRRGYIRGLPPEPFGGEYILDATTGVISSSTHPERLHVYRQDEIGKKAGRSP